MQTHQHCTTHTGIVKAVSAVATGSQNAGEGKRRVTGFQA